MTGVLVRRELRIQRGHGMEGHLKMGPEQGVRLPPARDRPGSGSHQKPEELRAHPSPEPLGGAQSYQHLEFGLPAFRAVKGCTSVVDSHLVRGNLLEQPWETDT